MDGTPVLPENKNPNTNVSVNFNGQPTQYMAMPPLKSKWAAIFIALFLGGFGGHKFYVGKTGLGFAYLLFSWTAIPMLIALVELVIYMFQSDESWAARQGVRVA